MQIMLVYDEAIMIQYTTNLSTGLAYSAEHKILILNINISERHVKCHICYNISMFDGIWWYCIRYMTKKEN